MKPLTPEQRVLQKFIDYQQEFKDQTQDYAPGNRYWADKFMTIIGEAKKVLNTAEDERSEHYLDNFMCAFCNHFQIDTSDFDMTAFLKDWLQQEDE